MYLLPKTEETQNPKNYRPITCLSTMYKIVTSIITKRTYSLLNKNNLLPAEQRTCKKGSYGCKDQLLINRANLQEVKSKKKILSTAWINYRKASNSIAHFWIEKSLKIYRVCSTKQIRHREHEDLEDHPESPPCRPVVNIETEQHQKWDLPKGSHRLDLYYTDDLKIFCQGQEQKGLLTIVKTFSNIIKMEIGIKKCAKSALQKGGQTKTTDLDLDINTMIKELD